MENETRTAIKLLEALTERSKELACLYAVEECVKNPETDIETVCRCIIQAIPPGWQFPDICVARVSLDDQEYRPEAFQETPWKLQAEIMQQDSAVGTISVHYTREMPPADVGPFLKEEEKLIHTIADRLSHFLTYKKMNYVLQEWQASGQGRPESPRGDWEAVLDLISQTDNALFLRISNKMLNHLCWSGIEEGEALRRESAPDDEDAVIPYDDEVKPVPHARLVALSTEVTEKIFRIAASHLSDAEILSCIQRWIQEDKLSALLRIVHRHLPLSDVMVALRRYFAATREEAADRYPVARGLKVFLIERVLSREPRYITLLKKHVDIEGLYHLLQKVIISEESQGSLGGKSANLFLAEQIVKRNGKSAGLSLPVRIPKTWYVSSDMMLHYMRYNNMDEIIEQKYKEVERVRLEYPHIRRAFGRSAFPPDMEKGLSAALDDLGERPLVVRPSSLLEERVGFSFGGKYRSVFLANQGTKERRLNELMRALIEVYASNFGPEPIAYRTDRRLLDFSEQLSLMIQEVVGVRVGSYFLPAYSGVAHSRNEFRWSPEIKEKDGVAWLVPGLGAGTAAGGQDEHPVLVVPGQPSLSVGRTDGKAMARGVRRVRAINLETGRLETVPLGQLLRQEGAAYPRMADIVSVHEDGRFQPLDKDRLPSENDDLAVTFDGLVSRSPFALELRSLLRLLEETHGVPVEISFASDGESLCLLGCRPLTMARTARAAPIPKDLSADRVVFSADRHISNGRVSDITHIVHVDPAEYERLGTAVAREKVLRAVSRLNELLPKRQFILMAPCHGCAGGAGGPGTGVCCSDVSNAALVVDLLGPADDADGALSFGIAFVQDLVESGVCYLPVFPDVEGTLLNERFLRGAENLLPGLLPEYATLAAAVRLIDVPRSADGKLLQVLMNADLHEAVAVLTDPEEEIGSPETGEPLETGHPESYWRWRHRMAEEIGSRLDPASFGVVGAYLFGSTKNGTAGPASDIDILIHFRGNKEQREDLALWLEGWSLCLDEINYLRTGYRSGGLLDVHIVTDEDIARKTSYAVKIDAVTDAAKPLKIADAGEQSGRRVQKMSQV
jgi:predicted nucleotidyltransferase